MHDYNCLPLVVITSCCRWFCRRRARSNCHVHPLTTWYRQCSATASAEKEMMSGNGDSRLIWVDLEVSQ